MVQDMTDIIQFVLYKYINSIKHDVACGVPQKHVFGPLLFIINTSHLPNALLYSKCIIFADDTTVYHTPNDLRTLSMTSCLFSDWSRANKLSLNVLKTNFSVLFVPQNRSLR